MVGQTITITVPSETYEPFRQQAEREQRSVEEALLRVMIAAVAENETTAAERQVMLDALAALDTPTLWQLVQRGAETDEVLVLAALNEKRQRQGLTAAEERVVGELIRHHDRAVLIRAKALALLRECGENVRPFLDGA